MSVDSPGRCAALAARWQLTFPIHSDPDGQNILRPLDLWNPDERGGIGWPAIVVYEPGGQETHRFRSRDFADRPPDDTDVLTALRELELPSLDPPPLWVPEAAPTDDPAALPVEAFGPYFRGIRSATRALAGRLVDDGDRAEASRMSNMAASFLDARMTRPERP